MSEKYCVTTFYYFVPIEDVEDLRADLIVFCTKRDIKGTILLAKEGINSTVAGRDEAIKELCSYLNSIPYFHNMHFKFSFSHMVPFNKLKIRIKKEIVTMKVDGLDLSKRGRYLKANEWDALLRSKGVVVIDTRNYYEYAIGTFINAINPNISKFSELPEWLDKYLADADKNGHYAMFCTGGVRCEKSTAYMLQRGLKNVYHLEDGIIKYIDDNRNNPDALWIGDCFIFDNRVIY